MVLTMKWLVNNVYRDDLEGLARRLLVVMMYAMAILFPLTWAWVAAARTPRLIRRLRPYQRRH
jgi:hypothetical protein